MFFGVCKSLLRNAQQLHLLREEVKKIMMTLLDLTNAINGLTDVIHGVESDVDVVIAKLKDLEAGVDLTPQVDLINGLAVELNVVVDKLKAAVPPVV